MSDKLSILIAYPYFTKSIMELLDKQDPDSFRLIVDSGAFTAWNVGVEVTMDGYCNFLKSFPRHWDHRCVQLDVYGDPEATYNNWKAMLDNGYEDIMPVFTRGDKLERLDEFYSVTDYIMFGGIAFGGENTNYMKFFSEANMGRKVHWLGFTDMRFIKHYKPESVDSSAITSAQRYGRIAYYTGAGCLGFLDSKDFAKKPPDDFVQQTKRRGFTMEEIRRLARSESWKGGIRAPNDKSDRGFASFVSYTHHIWRALEVERNLGTKIYLAFASELDLAGAFLARDFMRERGVL